MRERTTWNQEDILKRASTGKTAEDPTAMNQDHIQRQPPADKYLTGDPSTFAEDVHPSAKNWKAEYTDGTTTRDAIGLPEMRDDTFNHPETDPGSSPARGGGGRQASLDEETLVKKADLCCKVARRILGPTAKEASVEDQALALMAMSDGDLIETVNRMAQQDDQGQGQGQQEKQAKDLPPEFLENIEKKKEEAKDKKDEKEAAAKPKSAQDQEQGQGQAQQEQKEAGKKLGTLEQMAQQLQQMAQQVQQMMQQQMPEQMAQQQQMPEQQAQQQMPEQQAQQQEQQALDQMLQQQSNDQMIDQMLQQGQQPVQMTANNELGIQIDSPSMDIGEAGLTPEDDVLTTLFANNPEVQNAQQAHTLQHGAPAPLQVQAAQMTRTASTRTMGTKPTAGVASIGGLGSPASAPQGGGDVEKLSSLWNSAPDVSDVFRS